MKPVRLLALDAATERRSVALMIGDAVIARAQESGKSEAAEILGMVDALLAEAGTGVATLDAIAASVGPGAFTGVRVSVAVAQGLAFGAGLPVVPVMTLESLAFRAVMNGAELALACLDARMGEVYWGCFRADPRRGLNPVGPSRVDPPGAVSPADPGMYRGIGRGFAAHASLASLARVELRPADATALPDARELAALGALRLHAGEAIDAARLSPVYLRDKVALTEAERAGK